MQTFYMILTLYVTNLLSPNITYFKIKGPDDTYNISDLTDFKIC